MPGPPPKNPKTRQRRNKVATAAKLPVKVRAGRVPELPERPCPCGGPPPATKKRGRPPKPRPPCKACHDSGVLAWHPLTLLWWRDVWKSPMAAEYLQADKHGLYRLAVLVDAFWRSEDPRLASEIRLQGMNFGLTPLDRRRLQWEMQDDDGSKALRAAAATGTDDGAPTPDELARVTNVLEFR
jgi:hypothetical protein